MLKIIRISEAVGLKVFTDEGNYVGSVEEAIIVNNKIDSWRVRLAKESSIALHLGGVRGLIIPHQYVKAVGEVMIISQGAIPTKEELQLETEVEK